jgi:hypothetical protein
MTALLAHHIASDHSRRFLIFARHKGGHLVLLLSILTQSFTKVEKISVTFLVSVDLVLDIFSYSLYQTAAIKIQLCLVQPEVSISNKN